MKKLMLVSIAFVGLAQWGCTSARHPVIESRASLVGPAGPDGPAGPMGMQGPIGATGAPGAVVVGPAGVAGPAGPAGAQGVAGDTGMQGRTLVGPTGPAGRSGPAGTQGVAGTMGTQGSTMAGIAGSTGRPGAAGPQGFAGLTGAQGPVGAIDRWTSFRDFWFGFNRADLQTSEMSKVSEVAAYMKQNPSLRVGIDGSMDPSGTDPRNQDLSDRRISAVRDALIQAGVPSSKIQTGIFGDAQLARDRRVEVLTRTGN